MANKDDWRDQKEIMESMRDGAVRLRVEWEGENAYTARLANYGDYVREIDFGYAMRIPKGEGTTGPAAVSALFNAISGKTLEIVEGGTCRPRRWTFSPKGYEPA